MPSPTSAAYPTLFRGIAIFGIRHDASPATSRDHVLLLSRGNVWLQSSPDDSNDDAVIIAVDRSGITRAVNRFGIIRAIERLEFGDAAAIGVAKTRESAMMPSSS